MPAPEAGLTVLGEDAYGWRCGRPLRGATPRRMTDDRPPNSSESRGAPAIGLKFISGKYQGGEYLVREGQVVVVGRANDLDMVLVEDMVSRKHARISMSQGVLTVEDLGSTNGTFVNGEKVTRAVLHEGDRVLIGTNILKVVRPTPRPGSPSSRQLRRTAPRLVTAAQEEAPRMAGSLEEIPLPDLLQLFGTSRKDGVLTLRSASLTGKIYLRQGSLHFAAIQQAPLLPALKAIFRMLTWRQGVFELEPPDARVFPEPLDHGVQEVLMEGFRQQDELATVLAKLPPLERRLVARSPLPAPLVALDPKLRELMQLATGSSSLREVFDATPRLDLDVAQSLLQLVQRGYLQPG